jgi:predicted ArsR family transcriptional regulator
MSNRALLEEMKSKRKEAIEVITKGIKDTQNQRRLISAELRKNGSMTIEEISHATGIGAKRILLQLIAMRKNGDVTEVSERDDGYVYVLRKGK